MLARKLLRALEDLDHWWVGAGERHVATDNRGRVEVQASCYENTNPFAAATTTTNGDDDQRLSLTTLSSLFYP